MKSTPLESVEREILEEFEKECKKGWGKWSTACTHIELKPFLSFALAKYREAVLELIKKEYERKQNIIRSQNSGRLVANGKHNNDLLVGGLNALGKMKELLQNPTKEI